MFSLTNPIARRAVLRFSTRAAAVGAAAQVAPSLGQLPNDAPPPLFPGFRRRTINTSGANINVVTGGFGPPLLLLHGYPQTHVEWRKLAPKLVEDYTVVIPDLRGYGDSSKPPEGEDHVGYSKKALALDQVEVMDRLGFKQFAVVSHDRGARVAHRLALDHADKITKLVMMDIVPTLYMYKTTDRQFAAAYFHWFFLIQPAPLPESLIQGGTDAFLKFIFGAMLGKGIEPEAYGEYRRALSDPAAIHATCEEWRASATIDLVHDEADIGKKIECPVQVLWGLNGFVGKKYDVLGVWRDHARQVIGKGLPSGHWLNEEVPDQVLAEIAPFLKA